MTGFELRTSGVGSNRSTNWAQPLPYFFNVFPDETSRSSSPSHRRSNGSPAPAATPKPEQELILVSDKPLQRRIVRKVRRQVEQHNTKLLKKNSVTRFGKISPVLHNIKKLWPFWKGSNSICQSFELTWANLDAIGQVVIVENGKILKSNLAIWSHYRQDTSDLMIYFSVNVRLNCF